MASHGMKLGSSCECRDVGGHGWLNVLLGMYARCGWVGVPAVGVDVGVGIGVCMHEYA